MPVGQVRIGTGNGVQNHIQETTDSKNIVAAPQEVRNLQDKVKC